MSCTSDGLMAPTMASVCQRQMCLGTVQTSLRHRKHRISERLRPRPGGPRPVGTASLVGGLGLGREPANKWLSDTPALCISGG